ncbi:kinase-like domain-containing protein [Fomes fomentarius]|nr:kinase-like domain-containing protein [Fomes fomentarius]
MLSAGHQRPLPRHAYLSDEAAERSSRTTEMGVYSLLPSERFWQKRQLYLQQHGYLLRPRYSPSWQPSWLGTNLDPLFCEDSAASLKDRVLDARCASNNEVVAIKAVKRDSEEIRIAQYLTSFHEVQNHCVPILDVISDPFDHVTSLVVMPYLRPFNDPEFYNIGELVDFIDQTMEGLAFMHRHRVAHRDISLPNIMMDARPLFPGGHHPVQIHYTPDGLYEVSPLTRYEHPVQYYIIDFDLSTRFPPDAPTYVVGDVGRDTEVPELSNDVPYDPFKVDVFSLGNVYFQEFEQKYKDMEFLFPLIEKMKHQAPSMRPSIEEAIALWDDLKRSVDKRHHWRLSPQTEQHVERMVNDAVDLALRSYNGLRKYGAGVLRR